MTVYLFDGYNVLHELVRAEGRGGHGRSLQGGLEDERAHLLDRVASFMGGTHDRAIAVFDSKKAALQRVESASRNVEVYFGSLARSADAVIEKCAFQLRAEEDIVVVSSDHVVQQTVFMTNVTRMSSRQFVLQLKENERAISDPGPVHKGGDRVEDRLRPEVRRQLESLREELAEEAADGTRGKTANAAKTTHTGDGGDYQSLDSAS
jgi:predicted RNA-binding protein with PIN domain